MKKILCKKAVRRNFLTPSAIELQFEKERTLTTRYAEVLERSVSTICDEIARNKVRGVYDAKKAAPQSIHSSQVREVSGNENSGAR